jgi:hypothetical protein
MAKDERRHQAFLLARRYNRLRVNLEGLVRNRLVDELKQREMEQELKRAKKEMDDYDV